MVKPTFSLFCDGQRLHSRLGKTELAAMLNRINNTQGLLDHYAVGREDAVQPFATAHEWLSDWMTRKPGMAYEITPLQFTVTVLNSDVTDMLDCFPGITRVKVGGISDVVYEINEAIMADMVYDDVLVALEEFTRKG